ncbi:hypothetical protein J6590_033820 [Homalodisca vitripennis]|nr:hypothetical protein J6590_033820 [Homalodisca vitripennis]
MEHGGRRYGKSFASLPQQMLIFKRLPTTNEEINVPGSLVDISESLYDERIVPQVVATLYNNRTNCRKKVCCISTIVLHSLESLLHTSSREIATYKPRNESHRFMWLAGLVTEAYGRAATVENAVRGFRVSGIWPDAPVSQAVPQGVTPNDPTNRYATSNSACGINWPELPDDCPMTESSNPPKQKRREMNSKSHVNNEQPLQKPFANRTEIT